MGAEQVAVRVDHLGLDPEAELDAQGVRRRARAPSRPPGSLRRSTTQSPSDAVVLVAPPEPAVVEHEQLDAQVPGLARDGRRSARGRSRSRSPSQLLSTTGRGRSRHAPRASRVAVQPVERLAQAPRPVARPGDHGLRRRERRARLQAPRERLGMDARSAAGSSRTARPRPRRGSCPSTRGCTPNASPASSVVRGAAQGQERAAAQAAERRAGCRPTGGRGRAAGRTTCRSRAQAPLRVTRFQSCVREVEDGATSRSGSSPAPRRRWRPSGSGRRPVDPRTASSGR